MSGVVGDLMSGVAGDSQGKTVGVIYHVMIK